MKTIQAIYEGGIFRPIEPVQLAEGSKVNIEIPVKPNHDEPRALRKKKAHLDRIYEILSRRFNGGEKDVRNGITSTNHEDGVSRYGRLTGRLG